MRILTTLVAVLLLAGCSPDTDQHAHPRRLDPAPSPSQPLASQDRDFLERAAQGGNAEVTIGGLVDSRALRGQVVAFGHEMVADHAAINRQLGAIAAKKGIALPTSLGEHQAGYDRVVDLHEDAFDREFVRVMVEDHQQAVELFRSQASGGGDAELRAFAESTLPTIQAHLQHATSLAADVK
jgi:putative membrane protein